MTKEFWTLLDEYGPGSLVLDLVDDRFRLNIFEGNRTHTLSSEYSRTRAVWSDKPAGTLKRNGSGFQTRWTKGLNMLHAALQKKPQIQLFVNCVFFTPTHNAQVNAENEVEAMNAYLETRYQEIGNKFGEASLLRYPADVLRTDPDHKWGAAPYHSSEHTYRHFIEVLASRIS